jgi:hypothetical protein
MPINTGFSHSDKDGKSQNVLGAPVPTKEPHQRSVSQEDLYLTRFITPWSRPDNISAEAWRWWIFNEPIAMICRETLTANILALDWEISPRKSEQREELQAVIRYYTKLLERGGEFYDFDWTGLVEWIMADLQDLPFGAGAEIGRKNDSPTSRVVWIKPLDGGTLYPTLNKKFPVLQYYQGYTSKNNEKPFVTFPDYAISRTYMSPRPEIKREGWGLAPPEKVYFAMLMLYRGDKYYADLLLDTPPAGILDLGDMERDSALEWIEAFREFTLGTPSSFKVPVLYEHTTETKFLPFGKVPNDIMYDRITLKYAAIVASAYGVGLGDIGLQTTSASGETLAGSIREERKTKRTGFARAKKKIKYWIESFLPPTLKFNFVDLDDELNVALGRARLSTITALSQAQDKGVISADEHRLILLGDGLFGATALPEKPPPDAEPLQPTTPFGGGKSPERPGSLGSPRPPSSGGEGETTARSVSVKESKHLQSHLKRFTKDMTELIGDNLVQSAKELGEDELYLMRSMVDNSLFGDEDSLGLFEVIKTAWQGKRWFQLEFKDDFADELMKLAETQVADFLEQRTLYNYEAGEIDDVDAWRSELDTIKEKLHRIDWNGLTEELQKSLVESAKTFIGKSTIYVLKDVLLSEEYIFDTEEGVGYDNVVDKVYRGLYDNFTDYVTASVSIEVNKILDKVKDEGI